MTLYKKSRFVLFLITFSGLLTLNTANAYEAPVSDLTTGYDESSSEDELSKLKRQLSHLMGMNFPAKIESLQQEIQTLRGTLEKQSHEIKTLQEQQKKLYQDLDDRLSQVKKAPLTKIESIQPDPVAASPYQQAIEAIKNKKYPQAQDLLLKFLREHPKDKLAGNANFWLGEVYYQQGKKSLAKKQFEIIKKQYPTNSKVPNALLKIGYIEVDEENYGKGKEIFKGITKSFPGTPSAHLAQIKLDQLNKK